MALIACTALCCCGVGESAAVPAAVETEFRALEALSEAEVPKGTAKMSDESEAWLSARNLVLHERGLAFWESYPADPRRWEVWNWMSVTPVFTRETLESGGPTWVRDHERQRAWSRRYEEGAEKLVLAADASGRAKQRALSHLLAINGMNWRSRITTPEGQKMLEKMAGWFAQFEREFPGSPAIIDGVRAMAQVLDAADPARCQQFLFDVQKRYAADTPRDRDIRGVAEGRLKLLLGQAYPVWLRLAGLNGPAANTQEYRGKIVLIALFPIAWAAQAEFLRTLHHEFNGRGVEIIHVTGGESMRQGEGALTALETALLADEKSYPWRVAWDARGTIGAVARSMGLNGYPKWLLLSRDGRFVAEADSPREIMAAIKQELLIKSEAPAVPAVSTAATAFASETGLKEDAAATMSAVAHSYVLNFETPVDPVLQSAVSEIDARLRAKFALTAEQTAVGVLDLRSLRLALVRPDAITYAASVPKVGILLAWFQAHPEATTALDALTRHELGLMIKISDNDMASKFSRQLGIARVQETLNAYGFYDAAHGGGIWFGKHYGQGPERVVDPVGGHSHAATVRQLMRFYLLLEQGKLVSPEASRAMREIFASPETPHRNDRFVKGLAGREVEIRRKSGWWETWSHDTAVITGPARHYIVVALTQHVKEQADGADYLEGLAAEVDDLMTAMPARF